MDNTHPKNQRHGPEWKIGDDPEWKIGEEMSKKLLSFTFVEKTIALYFCPTGEES